MTLLSRSVLVDADTSGRPFPRWAAVEPSLTLCSRLGFAEHFPTLHRLFRDIYGGRARRAGGVDLRRRAGGVGVGGAAG